MSAAFGLYKFTNVCPVSRKAETSFCDQFLGLYFSINFWALLYSVYLLVMQEEMERNFKVSWEIHLEMIYIYIKKLHLNGIVVYAYSKMELGFVFVNFCTKT